jgi:hypothetical protein
MASGFAGAADSFVAGCKGRAHAGIPIYLSIFAVSLVVSAVMTRLVRDVAPKSRSGVEFIVLS